MRETIKAFLIAQLEDYAIEQIFNKQSTAGIYEAKKVIDKSFSALEELFKKPDAKGTSSPR